MPLSNLILQSYRVLIEVALWLLLLIALVSGWIQYGFTGAIISLVTTAIFAIAFFGLALVILDIQSNLRKLVENKTDS